jgi:RHS repeat-associated protein
MSQSIFHSPSNVFATSALCYRFWARQVAHPLPRKRFLLPFGLILVGLPLFSVTAVGQGGGTPDTSSYDGHAFDSVNIQNLAVSLKIPVFQKAGAIPFGLALYANSGCTGATRPNGGKSFQCSLGTFTTLGNAVFSLQPSATGFLYPNESSLPVIGSSIVATVACPSTGTFTTEISGWWMETGDGTRHMLPPSDMVDSLGCFSTGFSDQAIDNSGYTLSISGVSSASSICNAPSVCTIYGAGGTTFNVLLLPTGPNIYYSTLAKDVHNNRISFNYSNNVYTDTLGLTTLTLDSSTQPTKFSWTDVNSGTQSATINSSAVNLQSPSDCGATGAPGSPTIPTSISFADGRTLGISYEPNSAASGYYTGRLGALTLPTGGTITYTYSGFNCGFNTPTTVTRQTSDGTTTYSWSPFQISGSTYWGATTEVTDQGGNTTVYTSTGLENTLSSTYSNTSTVVPLTTEVQHNQDAGSLLTTDVYCYNAASGQPGNCAQAIVSLPIKEVDVYHTISGMLTSSRTQTKYDKYGNVIYLAQYDFGGATPTIATTTTYGTWNGTTCVAISSTINNKPCDVLTTQNGANVAESRFGYDSLGDLLHTYVWTGSSWLSNTTSNVYSANGSPLTSYDLANNMTSYVYSPGGYVSCGGCTNYPFPTSVTKGGLTTSSTWNGIGGVKVTDVGPNGTAQTTTYGYTACVGGTASPFWRSMSVTDPMGNQVCNTYPSGSSTDTANISFSFNSGNSSQSTTMTADGYGRPINVQTQQGPAATTYDTVSLSYIWGGTNNDKRIVSTNIPCTANLNAACPVTNQIFTDVLGRNTWTSTPVTTEYVQTQYILQDVLKTLAPAPPGEMSTKSVQTEYDGLGRPLSTCAISTIVSGNTLCGQKNGSYNGILTTYTYSSATGSTTAKATRGSQSHSETIDGLGRVTFSTTPEGGMNSYGYDTAGCYGTPYPGHLTNASTANGNGYCFSYDSLNRMTLAYGLSPSGAKYCRHLYYDASTGYSGTIPSGITISNSLGRMVEAATDSCSSGTLITDEWLSYDADGHVTDMWELTPHSGLYYHSHATFAGNGVPLTVQLANPNLYTATYGLDGEGRPSTLSTGSTVVVSGTKFNAASQPTYIYLGTGTDQSDYVYDPNTGNMKNWTFQVGTSGSETGTLTWNPNGTLGTLAINDSYNPGGSQTCTFGTSTVAGYDDLGRLLSDNCGSVWAQTFSYDQYDNVTKSGSSAWSPGYNPSNNHYNNGSTYDNSGNLTSDTLHNYTWDQFNKLSSIDSSACATNGECVTYDALGRIVETSYNGVYTEIWYTQLGKTVYMHGSTPYYAYWPTPGGGAGEVNGDNSTVYYMHKDWLGSSRLSSTIVNHTVISDQAYAPYGEVYNKQATGAGVPAQMFTGDTQDILSGLFDTPNRELNAGQGRWLSPDPAGSGWNQYAYAPNPNSQIDPSGLEYSRYAPPGCSHYTGCGFADPWGDSASPIAGVLGSALDALNYFGTLDVTIMSDETNGGPVASTASGMYTGSYAPLGWNGGQQQDWTAGTGADDSGAGSADADTILPGGPCSGVGIPCRVKQQAQGQNVGTLFSFRLNKWVHGVYQNYTSTVVDVNGDTVPGAVTTEYLTNLVSVNSMLPTPATWQTNPYTDQVSNFGENMDSSASINFQTFTASVGGISYQLTTQILQIAVYGPGLIEGIGIAHASIIVP